MKNSSKIFAVVFICLILVIPVTGFAVDSNYSVVSAEDTGITLFSDCYVVDEQKCIISDVDRGSLAGQVIDAITVDGGFRTEIIRNGSVISEETEIESGDIYRVYLQDESCLGFKDYIIQFSEVMTDNKGPLITLNDIANTETAPGYYESGSWFGTAKFLCNDGSNTRWPNNEDCWASWRPIIEEDGEYEVFLWKDDHRNAGTDYQNPTVYWGGSCVYTIVHADEDTGETVELVINYEHDKFKRGWISLGKYYFKKGTDCYVKIKGNGYTGRTAEMHFSRTEGLKAKSFLFGEDVGDGGIYSVPADVLDLTIDFNLIVDREKFIESFAFVRGNIKLPVDLNFINDNTVRITGKEVMEPGTRYIISFTDDVTSANGTPLVRDCVYVLNTTKENIEFNTITMPISDGEFVGSVYEADSLKSVISVKDPKYTRAIYIVLCVFDDSGRLVSVSEIEKRELDGLTGELSIEVETNISVDGASYAELYVWNGDNYSSLCDAETFILK